MHLHALLHVAIEAVCQRLFELFSLVPRLRLQILHVEEQNEFLDFSGSVNKLDRLDNDADVHVNIEVLFTLPSLFL